MTRRAGCFHKSGCSNKCTKFAHVRSVDRCFAWVGGALKRKSVKTILDDSPSTIGIEVVAAGLDWTAGGVVIHGVV